MTVSFNSAGLVLTVDGIVVLEKQESLFLTDRFLVVISFEAPYPSWHGYSISFQFEGKIAKVISTGLEGIFCFVYCDVSR